MPDYKGMYSVLCRAADDVIEPLLRIPGAEKFAEYLHSALLEAESIYIETSSDMPKDELKKQS